MDRFGNTRVRQSVRTYARMRTRRYLLPWNPDSACRDARARVPHIAVHTHWCSPRDTQRARARAREMDREKPGSGLLASPSPSLPRPCLLGSCSSSLLRDTRPQCSAITSISSVSCALMLSRARACASRCRRLLLLLRPIVAVSCVNVYAVAERAIRSFSLLPLQNRGYTPAAAGSVIRCLHEWTGCTPDLVLPPPPERSSVARLDEPTCVRQFYKRAIYRWSACVRATSNYDYRARARRRCGGRSFFRARKNSPVANRASARGRAERKRGRYAATRVYVRRSRSRDGISADL